MAIVLSYNRQLSRIMIDSIDPESVPSLVFKTLQGSLGVFFAYSAIKAFDVATVGIFSAFAPLIALGLSVMILGEIVCKDEITSLLVVVSAVLLILIGMPESASYRAETKTLWAVLSLAMLPMT